MASTSEISGSLVFITASRYDTVDGTLRDVVQGGGGRTFRLTRIKTEHDIPDVMVPLNITMDMVTR